MCRQRFVVRSPPGELRELDLCVIVVTDGRRDPPRQRTGNGAPAGLKQPSDAPAIGLALAVNLNT
jgi:hypothetical protein